MTRARRLAALGPLLATLALTSCGDTVERATWANGHPNTALVAFDATAPGLCTLTVRYPLEAPAVISFLGTVYVQVGKHGHAAHNAADRVIDHSGDWEIDQRTDGNLLLLTPSESYDYRPETAC